MIDTSQMTAELAAHIQSQAPSRKAITPGTNLLEANPVGSKAMTDLIAWVEARYGVRLEDADLAPRHFRSADCLVRLVVSKLLAPLNAGCLLCREMDAFNPLNEIDASSPRCDASEAGAGETGSATSTETSVSQRRQPSAAAVNRMRAYVERYRRKTGTSPHPHPAVTEAVVLGLAQHLDELGRPLCPCNFYPDKQQEVSASRRWVCACDEMKRFKYCHCLLFVTPEGAPITEYLPPDHEGRQIYGTVMDPTPEKGREARHRVTSD